MRIAAPLLVSFAVAVALPASADEISDSIQSALDAYNSGDLQYAAEELAFAQEKLQEKKSSSLSQFLPPAPSGWTMTPDENGNAGLAMMGGGVMAAATYEGDGKSIKITLMADNAMVASMAAVFNNSALMASMGKVTRVGRQKFVDQNGQLSTLVGNRVLVQAESGGATDETMALLKAIDYGALEAFKY